MDTNQLPIFLLIELVRDNPAVAIPLLIVLLGLVVLYYVAMVRSVIEMLRLEANSVLLVFAFLALFPFPLLILAGITILIIWRFHRRDLLIKSG
ncbi:MAG: hypothetical protein PVG92_08985 [Holophagae bacterium]|jgi:hypothetical protein